MLSHPNVIRLSDMTIERGDKAKKKRGSIYMVTPYMDHDLCGLLNNSQVDFSVGQIKCYMLQLLEGTRYLHSVSRSNTIVSLTDLIRCTFSIET